MTKPTKKKQTETANQAFERNRLASLDAISDLHLVINALQHKMFHDQKNWAIVGDMNHVAAKLEELVRGFRKEAA